MRTVCVILVVLMLVGCGSYVPHDRAYRGKAPRAVKR